MLNLTEFYYLNSTTITFNFSDCKTNNFIGFFQTLKKNSKIIEVVATKNSMTLFLKEAIEHGEILDIINESINSNKKNDNKSKTINNIEIPSLPNPPDTTIQIAVSSLNGSNVSRSEIIALTERLRAELLLQMF